MIVANIIIAYYFLLVFRTPNFQYAHNNKTQSNGAIIIYKMGQGVKYKQLIRYKRGSERERMRGREKGRERKGGGE